MDEVQAFLSELSPDDIGREDVAGQVLRFEGFTDLCIHDAVGRTRLPADDPRHLKAFDAVYERLDRLPDGPERRALFDEAKKLAIAYMPYKVHLHRIAVDLAIKALQKEKVPSFVAPVPAMVTTSTLPSINTSMVLAPASFQAVYSVAAPAK